ncbi:DUF983 domain-containing protein [Echinicola shivajiensis]|uniref:DUF983 domain-containing protein n=1 Tax=Echinicola shivajiensis TaxID=1035916 RepID=UPI001BFC8C9B|nr:DUF983 domain-containing protein [Echinicola shivajiensis]
MISNILKKKCPVCQKGKVFENSGFFGFMSIPKMHKNCPNCNHRFEKEPGFFFGAMYISYALCILEAALSFLLYLTFGIDDKYLIYLLIAPIILFWPFNYKMSRVIWMHII